MINLQEEFSEYIKQKFETIKASENYVYAEIGFLGMGIGTYTLGKITSSVSM